MSTGSNLPSTIGPESTAPEPPYSVSATSSLEHTKNAIVENASAAASATANAVKNHPITQNLANGPVAGSIKDQQAKTSNEFSNLAASRTTPAQPAATGQQLTHYHSFFSTLLSWDNPRASGIAFLSTVAFIFAARYLDILRYGFRLTWITLGVTVAAEIAGKLVLGQGLASQMRPKRYITISKDTLDAYIGDVHELINFFVIESQRILFAENILTSGAAFLGAFLSYYLIKIVPVWGLALISTSVLFLAPLIYKTNKEFIDQQLDSASSVVNQQTEQVKQLASHHAARATDATKQYAAEYSAKAQDLIGSARTSSSSPATATTTKPAPTDRKVSSPAVSSPAVSKEDFPKAPTNDFVGAPAVRDTANALRAETDAEPLIAM